MNLFNGTRKTKNAVELSNLEDELNDVIASAVSSRLEGIKLLIKYQKDTDKKPLALKLHALNLFDACKEYAAKDGGYIPFFVISNINRKLPPTLKEFYINVCGESDLLTINRLMLQAINYCDEAIKLEKNYFDAYIQKFNILYVLGEFDTAESAMAKAIELWEPGLSNDINGLKQIMSNLDADKTSTYGELVNYSNNLNNWAAPLLKSKFKIYFNQYIEPITKV